jgi:endonuclease/exonuclease/phosphatase family metal-dependent hydrolase
LARSDPASFGFPWRQLVCHATLDRPGTVVNVVTVHVPNGSGNGWKKIEALDSLRRMVLSLKGAPLVLTGDFNEPRFEKVQDGRIVTWGQKQCDGRWLPWNIWTFNGVTDTGDRWDTAVRWFFEATDESGIRNAFWDAAGHGEMAASHYCRKKPRWFDHVFVSGEFQVNSCEYLHSFREHGFSDHSALLASLSYAPANDALTGSEKGPA